MSSLSLFSLSASPFRVVPLPVAFFLSISHSRCFSSGTLFFFFVARSRKRERTRERDYERERLRGFDFESFPGEDLYLIIIIIRARV
jgi:hypothetical protein